MKNYSPTDTSCQWYTDDSQYRRMKEKYRNKKDYSIVITLIVIIGIIILDKFVF